MQFTTLLLTTLTGASAVSAGALRKAPRASTVACTTVPPNEQLFSISKGLGIPESAVLNFDVGGSTPIPETCHLVADIKADHPGLTQTGPMTVEVLRSGVNVGQFVVTAGSATAQVLMNLPCQIQHEFEFTVGDDMAQGSMSYTQTADSGLFVRHGAAC